MHTLRTLDPAFYKTAHFFWTFDPYASIKQQVDMIACQVVIQHKYTKNELCIKGSLLQNIILYMCKINTIYSKDYNLEEMYRVDYLLILLIRST